MTLKKLIQFTTSVVVISCLSVGSVFATGADFNDDGVFTVDDLDILVAAIATGKSDSVHDLSGDGLVDRSDIAEWLNIGGQANLGSPYKFADVNLDGNVDQVDFTTWNDHKFSETGAWSSGDFNGDGLTDGHDFVIWNEQKVIISESFLNAVPEPSGMFLVFPAALLLLRRRK
jgi:hypothetical protein